MSKLTLDVPAELKAILDRHPAVKSTQFLSREATLQRMKESAGLKDVLTKSMGSKNAANVVKATLAGLQQLRLREEIYRARGLTVKKPVATGSEPLTVTA